MGRKMIILGRSMDEDGNVQMVGVPLSDLLTHMLILGTTGSGKSTLLIRLAAQTFGLGATTCIIEPHGDLCMDTLATVPASLLNKVVYLSLLSSQPPAIPLMTLGLGGGVDVGVDAVMSVLRMAEPGSWDQSTQMREVLRHTIRAILFAQGWGASLLALDRFLTRSEAAFREQVLDRIPDEGMKSRDFCRDEISKALDAERGGGNMKDSIRAAQRRLEIFTTDQRFRRSLALPPMGPRINLNELLTGGRMVLVPVNAAEIGGRAAPLLSMLFMQMVKTAFLSRTNRDHRQQAVVIIDEFTAMAGGENAGGELANIVDTILREARKFGAAQILATQSVNQLTPEVKKNVRINTNHKIILLVSDPDEARDAADILGSEQINAVDIRNIPGFHGYIKAMVNKAPQPPCLLEMLPPQMPIDPGLDDKDDQPISAPQHPRLSAEWERVRELARAATDPGKPETAEGVVSFLRQLDNPTWQQVVDDAGAWNRYQAARYLADPSLEPDKVQRALKISRCLYGLPWWLREAHYWRELTKDRPKTGRPPATTESQIAPKPNWN